MKKKLFVMVGEPGSGKSTFVLKSLIPSLGGYSSVVSRDQIRFSLVAEDEEYFSKEAEVYAKFISDLKYFLDDNDTINVIADATHLNQSSRTKLLRALGTSLKDVEVNAVMIDTKLEVAEARNELRKGTRSYVPVTAIRNMYYSLTVPDIEEGFDNIIIVRQKGDK